MRLQGSPITAPSPATAERRGAAGALKAAAVIFLAVLAASCSGTGREEGCAVLDDDIYGFRLGERREDLFKRVEGRTSWKEVLAPRGDDRGEIYEFSSTPDGSRDTAKARLTFLDGCLMEVVVYFQQTNVTKLMQIKSLMEERYGAVASSPDGTTEMAFKTYWIKAPGMSVTVRRLTKKPEYELYVQFLHDELVGRLKERKKAEGN